MSDDGEQKRVQLLGERTDVIPLPFLRWINREDSLCRVKPHLMQQWQVNKYHKGELVSTTFIWREVETVEELP